MSILSVVVILFGGVAFWILWKSFSKEDKKNPDHLSIPTKENFFEQKSDETGEMSEKLPPINCQLAQFQPAPQEFFYVDCCGKPKKGEGFEPWEKRSPVSIDANKPFVGMTLLDVEAEKDC